MEKRYQVFISSTYADLKDERQKVIRTVMEMDCIPAGMELFPAADEEQFEFIKSVIDDCDYYLIIIGGRYGSETIEGISYTEKEYDYAIERDIKVIGLLHEKPDEIPIGKSEKNAEKRKKLETFRNKVKENRLIKFWNKAEDLPGLVALGLAKTIKLFPAVGWVRANQVSNIELFNEVTLLRKENTKLKRAVKPQVTVEENAISNIAGIDEEYTFNGYYYNNGRQNWSRKLSWKSLFGLVAPYLLRVPSASSVEDRMKRIFAEQIDVSWTSFYINENDVDTVAIQFKTLGLVTISRAETTKGSIALFWRLTARGEKLMTEIRTIRKK